MLMRGSSLQFTTRCHRRFDQTNLEAFWDAARRALGYRKVKKTSMSPIAVGKRRRNRRNQQKKHDKEKAKRARGGDGFWWG